MRDATSKPLEVNLQGNIPVAQNKGTAGAPTSSPSGKVGPSMLSTPKGLEATMAQVEATARRGQVAATATQGTSQGNSTTGIVADVAPSQPQPSDRETSREYIEVTKRLALGGLGGVAFIPVALALKSPVLATLGVGVASFGLLSAAVIFTFVKVHEWLSTNSQGS